MKELFRRAVGAQQDTEIEPLPCRRLKGAPPPALPAGLSFCQDGQACRGSCGSPALDLLVGRVNSIQTDNLPAYQPPSQGGRDDACRKPVGTLLQDIASVGSGKKFDTPPDVRPPRLSKTAARLTPRKELIVSPEREEPFAPTKRASTLSLSTVIHPSIWIVSIVTVSKKVVNLLKIEVYIFYDIL